jgi:pyruvate dehydrogenase E2 component (dihydrolipoamide acetyltransferase)
MPRQGQSVESCVITRWFKTKGEQVNEGDLLFSYETDKAAFEEEAPASGILLAIFFDEGDEVPVLTNVAAIGQGKEDFSSLIPEAATVADLSVPATQTRSEIPGPSTDKNTIPANGVQADQSPVITEALTPDRRVRISPLARKVALSAGVDISHIKGTGPNGRIIERDIKQAMLATPEKEMTTGSVSGTREKVHDEQPVAPAVAGHPIPAGGADSSDHKISNMRRIIAARMAESLQTAAQLTHHISADARNILALRKTVKAAAGQAGHVDISLNDMICFAAIHALKKHPGINAHFYGNIIRQFHKVHLGMAVDTDRGLMVPVLQNADDLNLSGLSAQLKNLANECKTGKIKPELLASEAASFTVTNLGAYGIEMFTPVLNLPQVAILGVNTITYRPADLGDGTIGIIPVIGLSLTYDHRAIDGAPASRFLKEIKHQIETIPSHIG